MSILYMLIPVGLILIAFAAGLFFWAVGNGQFDDLEEPAMLVFDDDEARE
ncbi:MAG: cbb3-type cytochrome oxidase assembly protein CcoS [Pseudomonadota bacterium]